MASSSKGSKGPGRAAGGSGSRSVQARQVLAELEQAARQLGVEVRVENGSFRGGRCVVEGRALIMLNRRHHPDVQLAILAESMIGLPTETLYLRPAVRRVLEEARLRRTSAGREEAGADAD